MDQIIYNAPATSQVVAIWVNDEPSENVETCDISIYAYSTSKHKVRYYFGCYNPFQYPLLYSNTEYGWHRGSQRVTKLHKYDDPCSIEPLLDAHYANSSQELLNNEMTGLEMSYYFILRFSISLFFAHV